MAIKLKVQLIGADEVLTMVNRIKTTVKKQEDKIGLAANDFVENFWKPIMPVKSGFMKNTATSLQQGKGKAIAFTQTSQKKPGGYAIYPERGVGNSKWQNPHFTEKAAGAFSEKYFEDIEIEIDEAFRG